ncbi:MAG: efflux RND transporter permease subunit [Leptospiraceae bacterium]|nr:efflux RND transporter permease subunit [Leptospiraceae bacterium]
MIEKIIETSIKFKYTVILITGIVCLIGIYNALNLAVDAVPDVTNVQVSAVTSSPGLSPVEVEQFITNPIELKLNGMPGVTEIRSISKTGVSSVTVIFNDNVDIWFARQLVTERLKQAEAEIPPEYGSPELSPVATALGDIYEFVLSSNRHTPMELRTYIDWELSKQLKSISGVIEVNSIGGKVKEYQVIIDPRKLAVYKLTVSEVLSNIKAANTNMGGGYIIKGKEQIVIRGEGQFEGIDEIERIAVRTFPDGTPLLLGQIAEVKVGTALQYGIATKNQQEVVAATVIMLLGENSREVVHKVKKKIKKLNKKLPTGMKIEPFYDRSEFINRALSTVFINLLEGAALVFITLLITLGSAKGAGLVALAIPISMLQAVILMRMFGVVGNLMSLGAIDFGLLVDGAVVILETVFVGFIDKQNYFSKPMDKYEILKTTKEIIIESSCKVGRVVTFSVAIIMLVYLPLMVLDGVEGRMFRPMAITVALALGAALIFSITTFPASLAILYPEPTFHKNKYWDSIKEIYQFALEWSFSNKQKLLLFTTIFVISSFLLFTTIGAEFIPRIDEGEIELDVKRAPSSAITYSRDLNVEIEKILREIPEIVSVVSRVGRGETAVEPMGTDETSIMIKLKNKNEWNSVETREEMMELIKNKILYAIPMTQVSLSQPIENRVNSLLAGSKADIVVKVYGDDLFTLKDVGDKIADKMRAIAGTGDIRVQKIIGLSTLRINTNYDKMARYGVSASEILKTVEMLRVGSNAGKIYEGTKRFDLVLRLDLNIIGDIKQINNIPIMTSTGSTIPLAQVADIDFVDSASAIYRENLKRRIFVEVNIRGRDLVSYIKEAKEKTEAIVSNLPPGYEVEWGGQFENFTRAKNKLLLVIPISLLIIFVMLIITFRSVFYAIGIFIVIPFAVSGGIWGLVLRDLPFSIPAAVGFIAVSGIAVLNGVVFASRLNDDLRTGLSLKVAIKSAGVKSLRPMMTTALIAAIGFIPMALSSSAGSEVQRPLATVVISGVLVASALTSLVLPITMEFLMKIQKKNVQQKLARIESMLHEKIVLYPKKED